MGGVGSSFLCQLLTPQLPAVIAVIAVTHEAARCHPPVLSVTWSRVVAPNHPHLSPTHWGWVSYWHRQRQRQSLHLKLVGEPGYSGRCKTTQYHAIPLHMCWPLFTERSFQRCICLYRIGCAECFVWQAIYFFVYSSLLTSAPFFWHWLQPFIFVNIFFTRSLCF